MLSYVEINGFTTSTGAFYPSLRLSYEVFGRPLGSPAPVVMVCHALTGNSNVCGQDGWWDGLISPANVVDTDKYCVLCFNIPGNGYDGFLLGDRYTDFTARDIARLFVEGAKKLGVGRLHTMIGGSLGACLVWEALAEYPDFAAQGVAVAGDWKSTDWVMGLSSVQMSMLARGDGGMYDARMMTMLFFRTPQSFRDKFSRTENTDLGVPNVTSWLMHHGDKLSGRFSPDAYRLMTHLISTVDISRGRGSFETAVGPVRSRIVQVGIDSDMYFQAYENEETHRALIAMGKDSHYLELKTPHGHDGFLIEFRQLQDLLRPFF